MTSEQLRRKCDELQAELENLQAGLDKKGDPIDIRD